MKKSYLLNNVKILRLIFVGFLAACVTTDIPQNAVQLNKNEIISSFSGKTVYGKFKNSDENWLEFYNEDGKAVYQYDGVTQYGIWRVESDALCTRYVTQQKDEEYCWNLFKVDDGFVDSAASGRDKGKVGAIIHKVLDGDTEGLMN